MQHKIYYLFCSNIITNVYRRSLFFVQLFVYTNAKEFLTIIKKKTKPKSKSVTEIMKREKKEKKRKIEEKKGRVHITEKRKRRITKIWDLSISSSNRIAKKFRFDNTDLTNFFYIWLFISFGFYKQFYLNLFSHRFALFFVMFTL